MNIWVKSILIAVGATTLTYILLYKKSPVTYKGHYVIRVKEYTNAIKDDQRTVERVAENIEAKLANAEIKSSIKILNDQLIDLTVSNLKYLAIPDLLNSNANLEFREMYATRDLVKMISKADSLLGYTKQASTIQNDATNKDTDSLQTFSEAYTPDLNQSQNSLFKLIQIYQPYETADKKIMYPAAIGAVLPKDTSFLDSVLQLKEILQTLPQDLKFLYGPVIHDEEKKVIDHLELFAVRSFPGIPAPISNNSIMKARVEDGYNNEPIISLEFNALATKKWERLTTENVGKPIAIIINDQVISAPNVNGPIAGGATQISGGLTKIECRDLVSQILAGSIPATVTIVKEEVSKERVPFLSGNLLLYFGVFLVASLLSYLIFNLLEKNKQRQSTRLDL